MPVIRVTASVTSVNSDGFYHFSNTSFIVLDPPTPDFYESFNAITWSILRINALGQSSSLMSVTEEYQCTVSCVSDRTILYSCCNPLHIQIRVVIIS